jgi:hypothetical protein
MSGRNDLDCFDPAQEMLPMGWHPVQPFSNEAGKATDTTRHLK